jgi:putative transposase
MWPRSSESIGAVQHVFDWFSVYGAVEPVTGDRFFPKRPYLNANLLHIFIDTFAHAFPDRLNSLLLDNSGAHTSSRLTLPEHIHRLFWPPYCPELNPIARVWRDLKDDVAWLQFTDLETQQAYLGDLIRAYEASTLQTLPGYPYLMEAIYALLTRT